MDFNLQAALADLEDGAAFTIANDARPGGQYLFATLLPEIRRNDYQASSGSMTVRATMAGLVGMDSPYPRGGAIDTRQFSEQVAKIALAVDLPEKNLRDLHAFLAQIGRSGGSTNEAAAREALNFVDKVIVQAHLDTTEWLRAQALVTGAISWTFNNKVLEVDYGVPSTNFLTNRTGNDAYGGSASKFWDDVKEARRILKSVRAFIMNGATREEIIGNSVNAIQIVAETETTLDVVRIVGSTERVSTDPRDRVRFVIHDLEGEVYDLDNPGKTKTVPLGTPDGKILAVGNNLNRGFVVGQGSTPTPENNLGYTHLAPTIEGNNTPGRWARVYVPQERPWALVSEGVSNVLPVIEAPEKLVVLSTDGVS
jgi:hypothetical protein